MHYTFPDIVGTTGSITLIVAYFLLQGNFFKSNSYLYLGMNLLAALLIMFSLCFSPNKASILIEIFWIGISVFGIIRKKTNRNLDL